MKKYDYAELHKQILKYLYDHRKADMVYLRTSNKLTDKFNMSRPTFNRAMYELKGMQLIDMCDMGNCKIWFLTEAGILKLESGK